MQATSHDEAQQKLRNMPRAVQEQLEIYAVGAGSLVSYSSCLDLNHTHYQLDYAIGGYHAWCPKVSQLSEWIQVSCENPKFWIGLLTQGRGDCDGWIRSFKVAFTLNGK
jgi:hypothetical protein